LSDNHTENIEIVDIYAANFLVNPQLE